MLRTISRVVVVGIAVILISPSASWAGTEVDFVEALFDGVDGVDGLRWPTSVAVSPDGKHVYMTATLDNAVAVFARDTVYGELTFVEAHFDGVGGVDGLNDAESVAVSPDGKHVYVASSRDDAVAVFSRNVTTGALTFVEAEFDGFDFVDGLDGAQSVAVSPDGAHLYVASSDDASVAAFTRNAVTGELTFVGSLFDGVGGIDGLGGARSVEVSPDGGHVYVAGSSDDAVAVFVRNAVSGGLSFVEAQFDGVGGVDGLGGAESVVVSPDGDHVYVAGSWDNAVAAFVRNTGTGRLSFVEAEFNGVDGVDGLRGAMSVAVSPDGEHVHIAGNVEGSVAVLERDAGTGELTFVEAEFDGEYGVDGLHFAWSVAVSPDGRNVYVAGKYDSAVAVFWKDFPPDLTLGNEAYYLQDWSGAETLFAQAIAAGGQTIAVAHNNRGLARCKQLDFAGAEADFDAAKSLAPAYVAPYINQGKCLAMQRDFAGARAEFVAGLVIDPDHVKLLFNLGWVEAEEGYYVDAIARYGDALTADSTYVRALAARGVALAEDGDSSSAVDAFYEVINTAPTGDLFAAMSAYNLQLLRGPGVSFGSDIAAQDYGDALFNMRVGLFGEAELDFIAAQTLEPGVPEIPWMLAWCRLRQLQTDAATDALADALGLMPVLDIESSAPSQLFIDGIFRGDPPQTVEVFRSRFDVAFRRAAGPQERTVVAYADGTPGGESPIQITLEEVSALSPFAAVNDTDHDWLGDGWEVSSFGDLSQSPSGDLDDDGTSNLREYWANTDPGSVLTVVALDGSAGEPSNTGTFRISRTGPTTSAMTVYYSVGGTATNGTDYTSISPTSTTIDASQAHRDILISPIDDSLIEDTETVVMTLTEDAAYTIGTPGNATVSITDDDVAEVTVEALDGSAGEPSDTGEFRISRTGPTTSTMTVFYSVGGTATNGSDYTSISPTSTTIDAGQANRDIVISPINDSLIEGTETVVMTLTANAAYTIGPPGNATVSITDDEEPPTLSINDVAVAEGDAATVDAVFTVSLSAASGQEVTVDYATANGTAVAGSDYVAGAGTLTFIAGDTEETITVAVSGDLLDELDETFFVNLSNPGNATISDSQGQGTITDDDAAPTLSIDDVTVAEDDSGTVDAVFTVSLSAASGQEVTVDYATADGTAVAGSDYVAGAGTLTFTAGDTEETITVPVTGDTLDELDETFLVNLSDPANATISDGQGQGTITDDDAAPTLSIDDVMVTEGDAGTVDAVFTVSLSATSSQEVTVDYGTADGTATAGSDYQAGSGTVTIPAGSASGTVTILVNGDTLDEPNETFLVNLSNPSNATITDGQGQGTITDDDAAPTLSIDDVTVTEGDAGTVDAVFTVSLSAVSGQEVTVDYATADGTATAGVDYVAGAGTLTFIAGDTEETITVAVSGDLLDELDETFLVNLSNPANATISDGQGQGTITDDERPLIVVKKQAIPEGDPAMFTFTGDVAGVIGGGQRLLLNPTPGTYTSTEVVPSGWSLFKCKCDDTDSVGDMGTATATIELSADESVTCVFTNCAESVASTLDLSGVTVSSTEMYEACDTLTADTFTIESIGDVSFRAGNRIVLGNGFSVAPGGEFTAEIVGEP